MQGCIQNCEKYHSKQAGHQHLLTLASGMLQPLHPLRVSTPCRFEGPEDAFNILQAGPEPLVSHFNVRAALQTALLPCCCCSRLLPCCCCSWDASLLLGLCTIFFAAAVAALALQRPNRLCLRPPALQVSYGLVLNLLSIYTLEQAREFCNRSFGIWLRVRCLYVCPVCPGVKQC
jgi:hypothetical protein